MPPQPQALPINNNNDDGALIAIMAILCIWSILLIIFSIRVIAAEYNKPHKAEFVHSRYLEISHPDGLWLIRKATISSVHIGNNKETIITLTSGKEVVFHHLADPNELLHAVCSRKD